MLLVSGECCIELRALRSLATLDLHEFTDQLPATAVEPFLNRFPLCIEAQPTPPLTVGADPIVSDKLSVGWHQ
jgi:hypothetical protein